MSSGGLHAQTIGPTGPPTDPGRCPRLVLAHGFSQNGRCWGPFARHLARRHEVVLVDAPGHGLSGHDDADLWESARLLTEAGGTGIYVGYSMGGRTALHAALAHPDAVRGLVLIGATPGLTDAGERADRRRADAELADRLLELGLPAFLDSWLALPLFAGLSEAQAARAERLTNRSEGLAASLRHVGTGQQEPLWERLHELAVPVLAVVGDQDGKFAAIARRMVDVLDRRSGEPGERPTAEVVTLPGTHAVHLEQPERSAAEILERIATW